MKQGWFTSTFGWLADDIRWLAGLFRQREMWVFAAIAGLLGLIVYHGFRYALRFDFTLQLRKLSADACRQMDDAGTAVMFFGLIFLGLTITMAFGEFARHLDHKRQRAQAAARGAALGCAGWTVTAVLIGSAMVFFLQSKCF